MNSAASVLARLDVLWRRDAVDNDPTNDPSGCHDSCHLCCISDEILITDLYRVIKALLKHHAPL